ncbi:MAG: hypothetical protein K6C12_03575 [Oscillospiraceae bacterium]|nr:hypothetical protein [Oscillospiraceae bacterium]
MNKADRALIDYIFVHGLSGWGSYDDAYRLIPYWGMLGGDLIRYLRRKGFSCYAASVSPEGSAWDRACELYAQLTGTVTDYGKEHSTRCGHARYGRDFSKEPLVPGWNAGRKIVLLGHSFGGATIRLFSELLANGSAEERESTEPEDLSPLFLGGQGDRIHALVTLAAPTNGTTAYDMHADKNFDESSVPIPKSDVRAAKLFDSRKTAQRDGRIPSDYAAFDMHIDNALALNEKISTLPGTYYFAFPCSATKQMPDGNWRPLRRRMEPLYRKTSALMGAYSGATAGGTVIGGEWKENDGLVNTVSAGAPSGAPSVPFSPEGTKPGVWNVMPVHKGDHMSLQGGMMKHRNIRPFYLDLLERIDRLPGTRG